MSNSSDQKKEAKEKEDKKHRVEKLHLQKKKKKQEIKTQNIKDLIYEMKQASSREAVKCRSSLVFFMKQKTELKQSLKSYLNIMKNHQNRKTRMDFVESEFEKGINAEPNIKKSVEYYDKATEHDNSNA